MKKIETAVQKEEKIRDLARRITALCAEFYGRATDEQKGEMFVMLADLEVALVAYREHELPWDGMLIDVVEKVGERRVKAKAFSTFESVMDKAREIFVYINQ